MGPIKRQRFKRAIERFRSRCKELQRIDNSGSAFYETASLIAEDATTIMRYLRLR